MPTEELEEVVENDDPSSVFNEETPPSPTEPAEPKESETEVASTETPVETPQPSTAMIEALRASRPDWDVSHLKSDDDLFASWQELEAKARHNQQLAEFGQRALEAGWGRPEPKPEPAPEPEQFNPQSYLDSLGVPELPHEIARQVVEDPATGMYVAAHPSVSPTVVAQANEHLMKEAEMINQFRANPAKYMLEKITPVLEHMFEEKLSGMQQQQKTLSAYDKFDQENASWLYTSPDKTAFSPEGERFIEDFKFARSLVGEEHADKALEFAHNARIVEKLNAHTPEELAKYFAAMAGQQQPAATPAPPAVETKPAQEASFLENAAKQRALHAGPSGNGSPAPTSDSNEAYSMIDVLSDFR